MMKESASLGCTCQIVSFRIIIYSLHVTALFSLPNHVTHVKRGSSEVRAVRLSDTYLEIPALT